MITIDHILNVFRDQRYNRNYVQMEQELIFTGYLHKKYHNLKSIVLILQGDFYVQNQIFIISSKKI